MGGSIGAPTLPRGTSALALLLPERRQAFSGQAFQSGSCLQQEPERDAGTHGGRGTAPASARLLFQGLAWVIYTRDVCCVSLGPIYCEAERSFLVFFLAFLLSFLVKGHPLLWENWEELSPSSLGPPGQVRALALHDITLSADPDPSPAWPGMPCQPRSSSSQHLRRQQLALGWPSGQVRRSLVPETRAQGP